MDGIGRRGATARLAAGAPLALSVLALAGCGGGDAARPGGAGVGWSCVPYARIRSGLALSGDAWRWWDAAAEAGLARGPDPRPGSVLVLMRTARLPQGHLAVVARVAGPRAVRVDHANWGSGAGKGLVARDQPVEDVSAAGDWSLVRVWYPPARDWGATRWPAYGFVHAARA